LNRLRAKLEQLVQTSLFFFQRYKEEVEGTIAVFLHGSESYLIVAKSHSIA